MAENKRLLILGKNGGGSGSSTGTDIYENQVLLPLYFENISDTSKDVFLGLDYNIYSGRFPNISLQKSLNNTDWEDITIPTTDGGREIISIPPKSRVYIKGVNEKFCNYQDGGYYNHYYFGTDRINREYIFVGGNLMSLIKGDEFKTYKDNYGYTLSSYAFCKLFVDGYFSGVGDPNIIHFEKMVVGFPSGVPLYINSNSFSYIFNAITSALNLSQRGVGFNSDATNCCVGISNIILNSFSPSYSYDILTKYTKDYLHIGFANGSTGISSYKQIIDKPNMTTETLTFVDENNVETNVVVYTQPTV